MRRFLDLPDQDQLRAFVQMHAWLKAGLEDIPEIDAQLAERDAALDAIRAAARSLDLREGVWPTAQQFNDLNRGRGWNTTRVGDAWGRWRFALDALNGRRVRPTSAQREQRSKIAGRDSKYEDPISALRRWRREQPDARSHDAYDAWTRRVNESLADDDALMPGSTVIRDSLVIPFTEAVRVADGEITLAEARSSTTQANTTWTRGPHDFVTKVGIARITGKTRPQVATLIRRHDFPKPVLVTGKGEAWLREDVEAFAAGGSFPDREHYELQELYLTAEQVADLLGVTPAALRQKNGASPPRIGQINGASIYYLPDIEDWLARRG